VKIEKMHGNLTGPKDRSLTVRSRVTNGCSPFVDGDARSSWSRRWKDLVALHAEDTGGIATLSEAKKSLLRRIASLEVELERMESAWSAGEEPDIDLYSRVSNTLRRLLESIGLDRVSRDRAPSLREIVEAHANEASQ
jgi:hypothetical protein